MEFLAFDDGFLLLQSVSSIIPALIILPIELTFAHDNLRATQNATFYKKARADAEQGQPKGKNGKYHHRRRGIVDWSAAARAVLSFVRHCVRAAAGESRC